MIYQKDEEKNVINIIHEIFTQMKNLFVFKIATNARLCGSIHIDFMLHFNLSLCLLNSKSFFTLESVVDSESNYHKFKLLSKSYILRSLAGECWTTCMCGFKNA